MIGLHSNLYEMKYVYGFLIPFLIVPSSIAQTFSGIVIDARTKESLAYVHIGVLDKNFGVISRDDGRFQIDLTEALKRDSLTFSIIGYDKKAFLIKQLDKGPMTVNLEPTIFLLKDVTVDDSEIVDLRKFGRHKPTKITTGHSGSNEFGWGGEWGLRIDNEGLNYVLQDINFHLRFNTVDSVLFRLNLYEISENLPSVSIMKRQVFVTSHKRQKWIKKSMASENIIIDQDIIVTFEVVRIWYSDQTENYLFFTHGEGYEKGETFTRDSSFGSWRKNHRPPITLYVTGRIF